jgi:hypothetical protein
MPHAEHETASSADRRKFLAACGKFAVITPPTMTLLLSTSLTSNAITHSGQGSYGNGNSGNGNSGKGNNGWGNGGGDGSPNGKDDTYR